MSACRRRRDVRAAPDGPRQPAPTAAALETWQLDSDPTGIWIAIPRSQLQALAETVPSKEGIEHSFEAAPGALTVKFEVDLKKSRA